MNPKEDCDLEKRHMTEQETADLRKALGDKQAAAATEQDKHLENELVVAGDEEDAQMMQEFSELNQETVIKIEEIDETEEADGEINGRDSFGTQESENGGDTGPDAGRSCSNRRFKCQHPGCARSFKNKSSVTQHQNVHTTLFQCRECGKCCQSSSELQRHLSVHSDQRSFACDLPGCGGIYKRKFQLKQHREAVHSTERPFQCNKDDCGKRFKRKQELQKHLKTHSSFRPFRCQVCQKCFKSRQALKRHQPVHSDDRPFVCNWPGCGGTFKLEYQLKQHREAVHSNERLFQCKEEGCGKSYKTKNTLKLHLKYFHSSLRPFRCQVCQKCFKSRQALKQHLPVHSDDRPFACDRHGCGGTFKWEHQLKQHRKQVHSIERRFKCDENSCDKSFEESEDLQKHIQTVHTSDRLLLCQVPGCVWIFKLDNTHVKEAHSGIK